MLQAAKYLIYDYFYFLILLFFCPYVTPPIALGAWCNDGQILNSQDSTIKILKLWLAVCLKEINSIADVFLKLNWNENPNHEWRIRRVHHLGQCGDEIGIYIYSNFAWLAISLYGASRTTTTRSLSPWPWSTRRTTTAWWTSPPSCRDEVLATINWRDELCYKIHSYIDKEPSSSIFQILSVRKGISDTWPNLHCHFFSIYKVSMPPLTLTQ